LNPLSSAAIYLFSLKYYNFVNELSDTDMAPKKYQAGLRAELQEMFNCKSIAEARKIRDRIVEDYRDVAESAVTCLDDGFESSMTVMLLPVGLQKYYRTSNHIERLNKELKRRSKVIGVFPNEDSVLRLMGSVLIEMHDAMLAGRAVFSRDSLACLLKSDIPAQAHRHCWRATTAQSGVRWHRCLLLSRQRLTPRLRRS